MLPTPCNSASAVFSPTPGTPGMLSTLSPISARKSIMSSGPTPNFSTTPGISITVSVMVFTNVTCLLTSCAISLSPVETTTSMPISVACAASVPMTSSASTPSITNSGIPIARIILCIGSTCGRRSSGMGGR